MKRFRYEAVDASGTPVFGVEQCDHVSDLKRVLNARGQTIRNYVELSLEEFNRNQATSLPRLFQLRVGERIQDALLTGLPAHEAVRAVASEPIQTPLLFVMPWLYLMATIAVLVVFAAVAAGALSYASAGLVAVLLVVGMPAIHFVAREFLYHRPRRMLLYVADRLENGVALADLTPGFLPSEMQVLLSSDLKDETKVRATSEIMPSLMLRSAHLQKLAMVLLSPIALFLTINLMLIMAAIVAMPMFREIFDEFGVTLPWTTGIAMTIGNAFSSVGWSGLAIIAIVAFSILAIGAYVVASGTGHAVLAHIPLIGSVFTWSMQARVCRMMSTLCRNEASNVEIIGTSTAISGFRSVKLQGQQVVHSIQQGDSDWAVSGALSGLPISMLKGIDGADSGEAGSGGERRAGLATTFHHLAAMLEQASVAHSTALAGLVRLAVYAYAVFIFVATPFVILFPLIKLLNDLS